MGGWLGEGTLGEVEALVGSGITAGDNFDGASKRCGGSFGLAGSNVSMTDLPPPPLPRVESRLLFTWTPPGANGGTGM